MRQVVCKDEADHLTSAEKAVEIEQASKQPSWTDAGSSGWG